MTAGLIVAEKVNTDEETITQILKTDLNKTKVCARILHKLLCLIRKQTEANDLWHGFEKRKIRMKQCVEGER